MSDTAGAREPKFPNVHVQLSGEDGNVFGIIERVHRALRRAGATQAELDQFVREMESGTYDQALQTVGRWVRRSQDDIEDTPDASIGSAKEPS